LPTPDIFLSYNREDHAAALRFAAAFRAEGFDVWWDARLKSGEAYDKVTENALHEARAVVVLWSPRSVESRWVRAEATVGDRRGALAPAMIEPCRRPVMFELIQTAELSHWKGDRNDPAWRAFVEDVRGFTGGGLRAEPEESGAPPPGRTAGTQRRLRAPLLAGLAGIALLLAGALWWFSGTGAPTANAPLRVATFDALGGPQAGLFAQSLKHTIIDVMREASIPTTTDEAGGGSPAAGKADLVLNGSVTDSAGGLKVFAQIQDASSGFTIWSEQFEGDASHPDRLSTAVAVAAAEPLASVREAIMQKGLNLTPEELALLIKPAAIIDSPQPFQEGMVRRAAEEEVARSPNVAYGHANLALALVQDGVRSSPDQRAALFEQASSEANRAVDMSPAAAGNAYDALYLMSVLADPGNIAGQEEGLLEGLRNAPDSPFLNMRECQFLFGVGRIEDSWYYCQRSRALRPLAAPIVWRYALALKLRGEQALAEQAIDQAVHYYPDNGQIRIAKLDILAFGRSHERAEELLPAMLDQGEGFGAQEIEALQVYLAARQSQSPGDADRAAVAIQVAATKGKLRLDLAVEALASLDRVDQAFALLERIDKTLPPQMDQAQANPGTSFLFAPETTPLRADARFWDVATRLGLVGYWTRRDKWPDFCGREYALQDCRTLAAKAGTGAN
jgi:tetratricopeptide (TPR) repeat protein